MARAAGGQAESRRVGEHGGPSWPSSRASPLQHPLPPPHLQPLVLSLLSLGLRGPLSHDLDPSRKPGSAPTQHEGGSSPRAESAVTRPHGPGGPSHLQMPVPRHVLHSSPGHLMGARLGPPMTQLSPVPGCSDLSKAVAPGEAPQWGNGLKFTFTSHGSQAGTCSLFAPKAAPGLPTVLSSPAWTGLPAATSPPQSTCSRWVTPSQPMPTPPPLSPLCSLPLTPSLRTFVLAGSGQLSGLL